MLRRLLAVGFAALAVLTLPATPVLAEEPKNKGLFVTPVREFITVAPAASQQKSITLANNTDQPMTIDLSVEQFTVTDYAYDFHFKELTNDWIRLGRTQLELQPGKSTSVSYTVAPPQQAPPGGHYFSVFASATVQNGAVASKVRAATTVYVTVQGDLALAGELKKVTLPTIAFGDIPFSMDVKNTGNTHFFAYVVGEMQGSKSPDVTHLLMPGTVRTIGSTIPAPLWPGVYAASVGYVTDDGKQVSHTQRVVYVPVWAICAGVGLVWIVIVAFRRYRRHLRVTRNYRVSNR